MIIERGPAPSMVDFVWDRESPYPPHGFGKFINDHILKDTPYEVKMHRDLSIFCDGTPLYADPDSIGFKDPEMGKREITLEEHQKIMATIYANCRAIGWPEDLSWVVKNSSGEYMFKQDVLYPDPLELPKEERLHYVGYRQYPGWKDVYPQLVQEW
jgi:hypothetical protein